MSVKITRYLSLVLCATALAARADEKLPVLKVGSEVYSNVLVTSVTATDLYFTHSGGIGSAKLKNLDVPMQRHFRYNPARAGVAEKNQRDSNAQFRQQLNGQKPATAGTGGGKAAATDKADPVAPKLHAKSFRGQAAPRLQVERWVTPPPNYTGKWVLVDFWATWCGPCRKSIPHLNALAAKYKDRMVVIGLSDESVDDIQRMTSPRMDYLVASDTAGRTMREVQVEGIPHAMLIDPKGIVRFEGMPSYLTQEGLEHLLNKYSN